jgi:hypothetical protein
MGRLFPVILLGSAMFYPCNSWGAVSHFDALGNGAGAARHPNGPWTTAYGALGTAMLGLPNGAESHVGTAIWRDPSQILYSSPLLEDNSAHRLTSPLSQNWTSHQSGGQNGQEHWAAESIGNSRDASDLKSGNASVSSNSGGKGGPNWTKPSGGSESAAADAGTPSFHSPNEGEITSEGHGADSGEDGTTTSATPATIALPEPATIVLWSVLSLLFGHHLWRKRGGSLGFGGGGSPTLASARRKWSEENRRAIEQIIHRGRHAG